MAGATATHVPHHSSSPTFHDAHYIDTHVENKESQPFRLDRHRNFRSLNWRQRRYEQLYREQLWNPPDPVKNRKGTRGEVWHEARVKQTLAVRPVWLRTCHCMDCVRFRFMEKEKEKRVEVAYAIKKIERSGGDHLCQPYPGDCWDTLCTGCLWDMPSDTEEDGNEAGENHSAHYDPQRMIPLEVDILDLLMLPRRSRRRGEYPIGSVTGHMFTFLQSAHYPISFRARGCPIRREAPCIPTARVRGEICQSRAPLWIGINAVLDPCEAVQAIGEFDDPRNAF